MADDFQTTLHEAEAEGYSMLGRLRPGDRYYDKLLKRLDGTKGTWVEIVKFQSDRSELQLGPNHKDRTCWVFGVDEDGRERTMRRMVFNLALAELNHPDSIAELRERHGAPGQSFW